MSRTGDTVLDPFDGKWHHTARSEGPRPQGHRDRLDERYCEIAAKRMAQEVHPWTVQRDPGRHHPQGPHRVRVARIRRGQAAGRAEPRAWLRHGESDVQTPTAEADYVLRFLGVGTVQHESRHLLRLLRRRPHHAAHQTVTQDSGLVPTLDFRGVGCMLAHYSKPHTADTSASETSAPDLHIPCIPNYNGVI